MRSNPLSRFRFLPLAVLVMTFAPPAALAAPAHPVPSAASQPGLGMSQAEARARLKKQGYSFERIGGAVQATAPGGMFVVYLTDSPSGLIHVGAMMGLPNDPAALGTATAYMVGFLGVMFPDWPGGPEWVGDHLQAAMSSPQVALRGERELSIEGVPSLGFLSLSVDPGGTAAAKAEAVEAARSTQADAQRAEGLADIAAGDAAAERGDYDAAMRAWTRAYKNPETSLTGAKRISEGWRRKAAALADAGDWVGAAEAIRADRVVDAASIELRGRIAAGLLPANPSAAAELLAESPDARVQFADVYRKALIAKVGDRCSDGARDAFRAANGVAPLRGESAERAASCEAEEGRALVDRERYAEALQAYDAARAYSPSSADVAALGWDLSSAGRNKGMVPGIALLAGGGAAAVVAVLRQGAAQATVDELRSAAHPSAEVDALIAEGGAAQLEATLLSLGALALGGTGIGVIVTGGARVPEELRGLQLSLAPAHSGGVAVLSGAF